LPMKGDGLRWANSDPITGQAAWYDLKVNITKAEATDHPVIDPDFPILAAPPDMPEKPDMLRYGDRIIANDKKGGSQ
ncbi:MAG: hypothetical protein ACPHW5_03980, partial [Candidatus Puniceispirillales bacterium]